MVQLTDRELAKRIKLQTARLRLLQTQERVLIRRKAQVEKLKALGEAQKKEIKRIKELKPSRKRSLLRGIKRTSALLSQIDKEFLGKGKRVK